MKQAISLLAISLLLTVASLLPAQEPRGIPQHVVDDWAYFIGQWQVDGQVGGARVVGTATFKWSKGRQSYIGEQVWKIGPRENVVHLSLLGGWDASRNQTIEQGFDSSGGRGTTRYEIQSGDEFPATKSGTVDGHSPRGGAWSGDTSIKRIGPNQFELTTTIDGDRLHMLTFRKQEATSDR